MKISGKPVQRVAWQMTEAVLAEFNAQTGKSLGAINGAGQPSEHAKRIYGRVIAYPKMSLNRHAEIIRRTLGSRWWGEGEPSVGVVYGPRIFEDNMERQDARPVPSSRVDSQDELMRDLLRTGGDIQ
jgi:hypothetical protein